MASATMNGTGHRAGEETWAHALQEVVAETGRVLLGRRWGCWHGRPDGCPLSGQDPAGPSLSRAAEEGRSAFAEEAQSASLPALESIVLKLVNACEKEVGKPAQNGSTEHRAANGAVLIDPLLTSRIHLGF